MKVHQWLVTATAKLREAGIATARLDCLVLLEDVTKKSRTWLLAHPEATPLQDQALQRLNEWVARRAKHEPLAYIRGKSEFYGREFIVNEHTLEPRPETETMIELALNTLDRKYVVLDIGTGSGAIAITLKLEIPELDVIGADIDKECIRTAQKNAKKLSANVRFYQGNLLKALPNSIFQTPSSKFAILANLPYVPNKYELNQAANFEPKHAIFGGEDGLDLYRDLFTQLSDPKLLKLPSRVLTESLPFQHKALAEIAEQAGYILEQTDDFIQLFRVRELPQA